MKIYLVHQWHGNNTIARIGYPNCLVPFHNGGPRLDVGIKNVLLDSGAYSVMTTGKEIDLGKYIIFIKKNRRKFNVYAGLDAIGDHEKTWRNQRAMERVGLNPLPTFHKDEPWEILRDMCHEYKYIALGGLVGPGSSPKSRMEFLNIAWPMIMKENPKLKVHGWGLTSKAIITKYPFYSVDSNSWISGFAYGNPQFFKNGKMSTYSYKKNPEKGLAKGHRFYSNFEGKENGTKRMTMMAEDAIKEWLKYSKFINRVWESRGVKWDDDETIK